MAECRGFKNKLGTTIVSLIAKVTGAIAGNIATFNNDGEVVDSGVAIDTSVTQHSNNLITSDGVYNSIQTRASVSSLQELANRVAVLESVLETTYIVHADLVYEGSWKLKVGGANIIYDIGSDYTAFYNMSGMYNFASDGDRLVIKYANDGEVIADSTITKNSSYGGTITIPTAIELNGGHGTQNAVILALYRTTV